MVDPIESVPYVMATGFYSRSAFRMSDDLLFYLDPCIGDADRMPGQVAFRYNHEIFDPLFFFMTMQVGLIRSLYIDVI